MPATEGATHPRVGKWFELLAFMPRPHRQFPDNVPQHVVNRGNRKARIFHSPADYLGFLAGMADAAEKTVVRVVSFCLMPNHWHLVLWPHAGDEISSYMQVLMNAHLRDLMRRQNCAGEGHFYKGRFRPHPIENHWHFLNVCRYVEANARRARLCDRAEDWPWSSLTCAGPDPEVNLLAPWPIAKPRDWLEQVNAPRLIRPTAKGWEAFECVRQFKMSPIVSNDGNQRRQIQIHA